MGLVSCPSHVFLNQLDTPIPAHVSQYLWWAWEEKASSYSSASRHGHAVSSVYNSQYLKTARKSCNLFKELLTLDDLALGGIYRVMAFWNICFILRRSSHLPFSTDAKLTKDWLEIGLFVLLFCLFIYLYQKLFSRSLWFMVPYFVFCQIRLWSYDYRDLFVHVTGNLDVSRPKWVGTICTHFAKSVSILHWVHWVCMWFLVACKSPTCSATVFPT